MKEISFDITHGLNFFDHSMFLKIKDVENEYICSIKIEYNM